MKFNALAVFLLLAEPGSPFPIGKRATRPNLKRSRNCLSASPDESGLVSASVKYSKYKSLLDVNDSPGSSLGIPEIPAYVRGGAAPPKSSVVNEFVNTARENYQTTRSAIVDSPQSPGTAPPLGEYVRNSVDAVKGSVESVKTTYLPEGKVPTLAQLFQQKVTGAGVAASTGAEGVHVSALANAKAKFGIMLDNAMSGLHFHSIDSTLPAMTSPPEGSAGWIVAGFALLVASGQRKAGLADAKAEMQGMLMGDDTSMGKLSQDMKSMAEEIKKLTTATGDLRKELSESKAKLAQKELQISKEQLKTMEKEAKLMQELEKMQAQLKEGDRKVTLLVQELEQTVKLRAQLVQEMDKVKGLEAELRKARGEPEPKPEKKIKADTEPSVTIIEPDLLAILEERAKMGNAQAPAKKRAAKGEKKPDAKAGIVKKTVAKKATRKTANVVKGSTTEKEPFFLKDAEPKVEKPPPRVSKNVLKDAEPKVEKPPPRISKKPAKEPEIVSKGAEAKEEKPAPKVSKKPDKEAEAAAGDFRSLSKSTLSRKTVKQLMEFLEAKGAVTTGGDGKPLKKAVLVESVQSL